MKFLPLILSLLFLGCGDLDGDLSEESGIDVVYQDSWLIPVAPASIRVNPYMPDTTWTTENAPLILRRFGDGSTQFTDYQVGYFSGSTWVVDNNFTGAKKTLVPGPCYQWTATSSVCNNGSGGSVVYNCPAYVYSQTPRSYWDVMPTSATQAGWGTSWNITKPATSAYYTATFASFPATSMFRYPQSNGQVQLGCIYSAYPFFRLQRTP